MTSYRRINSRTINRDVQQDNMVYFNKPLSQAVYPNYFSVPDASNTSLLVSTGSKYSATASPNLTFDGTTLDVLGNLDVNGTIQAQQFLPGQVVNMNMLGFTQADLSQNTIIISATNTATIFSFLYTPKIANSSLLLEYQTNYSFGGGGADNIEAFLYVTDATELRIARTIQHYEDAQGGGTRSGTILPIVGRYDNSNLNGKTIRVDIFNNTDADPVTVFGDNSTWLKITEIGR